MVILTKLTLHDKYCLHNSLSSVRLLRLIQSKIIYYFQKHMLCVYSNLTAKAFKCHRKLLSYCSAVNLGIISYLFLKITVNLLLENIK